MTETKNECRTAVAKLLSQCRCALPAWNISNLLRCEFPTHAIETALREGRLQLQVDSDAFIVKGLLAVVLAAYNNQTPADILSFDIDHYFEQLDLLSHLSPTRGNGLRAMVKRIQEIARKEPADD